MRRRSTTLVLELLIIPIIALPIYVWVDALGNGSVGALTVFPLLGLLAFSIMWWHFLLGFVKDIDPKFAKIKSLHKTSSIFVFLLILLHPMLLYFYSVSNSLGGPPDAYYNYVSSDFGIFITYGLLALIIFLLYDLARWLRKKPWVARNWLIVDSVDDVAFIAVFVHSIMLGQHLQDGWFRYLWIFYGVSALIFIGYKHYRRFAHSEENKIN